MARQAAEKGAFLQAKLRDVQERWPIIGDVRGRGLMVAVEFIEPLAPPDVTGRPPHSGRLAAAVRDGCFARKLICELGGRGGSVIRLLPPLTTTYEELELVVERFAAAVQQAGST